MDEKQLSIRQVQHVMQWSYPTALKWVQKRGKIVDVGIASGKWFVPVDALSLEVDKQEKEASETRQRLNTITGNARQ